MASTRSAKPRDDRALAPEPVASPTATPEHQSVAPARDAGLVPGQAYGQFAVAPKLDVGSADDAAEVEADRIADQVVEHLHGTGCGHAGHEGHAPDTSPDTDAVRRSPAAATAAPAAAIGLDGGAVSADNEQRITAARAGGRSLPALVRREMEGAFGADFSSVRVHSGSEASALNEGMSARAFTVGNDIFFKEGLPDTAKPAGAHLLAHELSHVVQQAPGAARAVVRRDPDLLAKKISRPTDVTVRTGASDTPVALNTATDVTGTFGVPTKNAAMPLLRQDAQADLLAKKPVGFMDKARNLFGSKKKDDEKDAAGSAPAGPAKPATKDGDASAAATPGQLSAATQMPTVAALKIENKGVFSDTAVDATMEAEDPYKAVTEYEKYAGKLLQNAQTSDTKVETFARVVDADHLRIEQLHLEYLALDSVAMDPKKKLQKKAGLEERVGAKGLPDGVTKSIVWIAAKNMAEERTALAATARQNANDDVPLVDSVYEMAREEKKEIHKLTGGRSNAHAQKRFEHYEGKGDIAAQQKHHRRQWEISQQAAQRAQKLGLSVREAHLSEGRLAIKAKELEFHKAKIGSDQTMGDWFAIKGKSVGKAVIGAGISTVTLGILGAEEGVSANADGKDGKGTKALGAIGMKPMPMWKRLSVETAKVKDLQAKKPYGSATSFHAGLQVFNAVLRELRGVVSGLSLFISLLGAAVTPLAGPAGAAIMGVGITLGLIALGITLLKLVIEAVLASWSGLARAVGSNARNNNLLEAQARSQAAEGFTDLISGATQMGLPAATNAAFSADSGHGLVAMTRPDEYLTNTSLVGAQAKSSTAALGWTAGQKAMSTGGTLALGVGSTVLGSEGIQDGDDKERVKHRGQAAPVAPAARVQTFAPKSEEAARQKSKTMPHAEPAWIKEARASEGATRDTGVEALVSKHSRTIGQFHDKTQVLMNLKEGASTAAAAKAKLDGAKSVAKKDEDSVLETVKEMSANTGAAVETLAASGSEIRDPKKLMAAVIAELKSKQLEAGMAKEGMA